jgi:predicted Co/Zn/Cd cation transporter (cation efflux family)
MGLIGLAIGLIAAAFGMLAGLMGASFRVVFGLLHLLGPLTPLLIVVLLIFWLAEGPREGTGYARTGDRK